MAAVSRLAKVARDLEGFNAFTINVTTGCPIFFSFLR